MGISSINGEFSSTPSLMTRGYVQWLLESIQIHFYWEDFPKNTYKDYPKYGPGNFTWMGFFPDLNTIGPIFRSFNPPFFSSSKRPPTWRAMHPMRLGRRSKRLQLCGWVATRSSFYLAGLVDGNFWCKNWGNSPFKNGITIITIFYTWKNQIQIWPTARPTAMASTSQTRQKNIPTDWLSRPASGAAHGWPAGRGSGWRFCFSPPKDRSW